MPIVLSMRALYVLTSCVLICPNAQAAEVTTRRLYEIVTETAMPHLEENLRYATTREQRCLQESEL